MADTQRIYGFTAALKKLPQYKGWEDEEIAGNIDSLFAANDPDRITKFTAALSTAIPQYDGWQPDEITTNIKEIFGGPIKPEPTPSVGVRWPPQGAAIPPIPAGPESVPPLLRRPTPEPTPSPVPGMVQAEPSSTAVTPEAGEVDLAEKAKGLAKGFGKGFLRATSVSGLPAMVPPEERQFVPQGVFDVKPEAIQAETERMTTPRTSAEETGAAIGTFAGKGVEMVGAALGGEALIPAKFVAKLPAVRRLLGQAIGGFGYGTKAGLEEGGTVPEALVSGAKESGIWLALGGLFEARGLMKEFAKLKAGTKLTDIEAQRIADSGMEEEAHRMLEQQAKPFKPIPPEAKVAKEPENIADSKTVRKANNAFNKLRTNLPKPINDTELLNPIEAYKRRLLDKDVPQDVREGGNAMAELTNDEVAELPTRSALVTALLNLKESGRKFALFNMDVLNQKGLNEFFKGKFPDAKGIVYGPEWIKLHPEFEGLSGEEAANIVLRELAQKANGIAKANKGQAFRHGGDEYSALFLDTNAERANAIKQELQAAQEDILKKYSLEQLPDPRRGGMPTGAGRYNVGIAEDAEGDALQLLEVSGKRYLEDRGTHLKTVLERNKDKFQEFVDESGEVHYGPRTRTVTERRGAEGEGELDVGTDGGTPPPPPIKGAGTGDVAPAGSTAATKVGFLSRLFGSRKPPVPPKSTGDIYADNLNNKDIPKTRGYWDAVKTGISRTLAPISTRLKLISPSLKAAMRQHEHDYMINVKNRMNGVVPLLKKQRELLSPEDAKTLDYAKMRGDTDKINEITTKYGIQAEHENVRKVLDELHAEATKAGFEPGYLEEYWPRLVRDLEGLQKELYGGAERGRFEKAITEKTKSLGRPLTSEETAEIINTELRGYHTAKGEPAKPGGMKERKLADLPPNLAKYYEDSDVALLAYVDNVTRAIEARKLFGKYADMEGGKLNLDKSLGMYVQGLIAEGKIKPTQQRQLTQMLDAYFRPGKTNKAISLFRDVEYIDTMGSPFSALTQIQDNAFTIANAGVFNTLKTFLETRGGTSAFKVDIAKDFGMDKVAYEFTSPSRSTKVLEGVFKAVGLDKLERFGNNMLVNATLKRYSSMAQTESGTTALKKKIGWMFQNDEARINKAIQEFKSGEVGDESKFVLFNDLMDFKPLGRLEMPEAYNKHGSARILYMLKSYTIKQLDAYRNKIVHEFKSGDKKEATKNATRLIGSLVALGVGTDAIKDVLAGRKFDLDDTAVDNTFKLMGFTKYVIWKARQEGLAWAASKMIMPPFKVFESLMKDVESIRKGNVNELKDIKDFETWQSVPVVGRMYYWWLGKGAEIGKRKELEDPDFAARAKSLHQIKTRYMKLKKDKSANAGKYREKYSKYFQFYATDASREEGDAPITLGQYESDVNKIKKEIEKARELNDDATVKTKKEQLQRLYSSFNAKWKRIVGS